MKITINGVPFEFSKVDALDIDRQQRMLRLYPGDPAEAQKCADIWMRCARSPAALARRKAAVRALGLKDEIQFL